MLNPELHKALQRANSLTAESSQRIHFALILKGTSTGMLLAGPHKVPADQIKHAKTKIGGSLVVNGRCFSENSTLVFETARQPPPSWNILVKKLVHDETGLSVHPEFRQVAEEQSADEDEAAPEVEESVTASAAELQAQFTSRLKALLPRVTVFQTDKPGVKGVLNAILAKAQQQAQQHDWATALVTLDRLEPVLQPPKTAVVKRGLFVEMQQARLLWAKTRQFVQGELQKLEKAILKECQGKPEYPQVVAGMKNLYAPMQVLDDRLTDKLDEALNAKTDEQRTAHHTAAKGIIAEYIGYVGRDPMLAEIDDIDGCKVQIRSTLVSSLKVLAAKLS